MIANAASVARQTGSGVHVERLVEINSDWLDVHMAEAADGETKVRKGRMLARIELPHLFALAVADGKPVAAGLGICEEGWTGIFGMFTLAHERRRGHGHALLAAMADWTLAQGGTQTYLQVERDNPAALAFYAKLGFHTVHGYHYRTLWPKPSGAPND
ncbi:MAG: GNAT family N-acetyltransferase [Rhodospirillaceae bacterium]|nr:GNAT family N-acetyltransferase [Rhodospirillaceae bacterium]